jgi:hypothetical protein
MMNHNNEGNEDEMDVKEEVENTNKFNLNNLNLKRNRKHEKKKLSGKENKVRVVKQLSQDQMGRHWTEYKKTVNGLQVNLRQKIWLFQFIFTLLCMVIIYPTEFIW